MLLNYSMMNLIEFFLSIKLIILSILLKNRLLHLIFKVHGIECLGIATITLNLRGWTEGFITIYD